MCNAPPLFRDDEPLRKYAPKNELARHLFLLFFLHPHLVDKWANGSTLEEVGVWLEGHTDLENRKLLTYLEKDLGVPEKWRTVFKMP